MSAFRRLAGGIVLLGGRRLAAGLALFAARRVAGGLVLLAAGRVARLLVRVAARRRARSLGYKLALAALPALAAMPAPAAAQDTHLLIISGLGGEPRLSDAFHEWATSLADAARTRFGVPAANIVHLAERVERDPQAIAARSTGQNVEQALADLAGRAGPADRIWVVLFGHGGAPPGEPRLNLPGPDPTAADYARMLARFETQPVAFINTASASGDFVEALSGENRVTVTATRSIGQREETVFGRYFVEAFTGDVADLDKDGRISVAEAFQYATREVQRFYEDANRLQTEHARLDDEGDGDGGGTLARAFFLGGPAGGVVAAEAASDPALRALLAEKQELERRIEALRARKDAMDPAEYERELEALLVELALKSQEIRRREEGRQ